MKTRTVAVSIIIAFIVLVVGLLVGGWGVVSWIEGVLQRHALAQTQCVVVASHVADQLAGQTEISRADVAGVLDEMVKAGREASPPFNVLLDPWGNPLSVKVKRVGDNYVIFVRSAGPDGVMGNGDDYLWDKTRWSAHNPTSDPENPPIILKTPGQPCAGHQNNLWAAAPKSTSTPTPTTISTPSSISITTLRGRSLKRERPPARTTPPTGRSRNTSTSGAKDISTRRSSGTRIRTRMISVTTSASTTPRTRT